MPISCRLRQPPAIPSLLAAILLLASACEDRSASRATCVPNPILASAPQPSTPAPPPSLARTRTAALGGDNLALGRTYTVSASPNYQHCTDPGDASQLTDGHFAQGYFWTDQATVGWTRTPRIDIVIDLGSVQPIGTIAINTAGGRTAVAKAGVELPDAWFLVSNDGRTYHQVARFHGYRLPDLPDSYVRRYIAGDLSVNSRYIAVVLVPNGPFAFLDEIEVLRAPAVARAPAGTAWTLTAFAEEIGRQRGALVAELARERSAAARRATVRANLLAAGGIPAALETADGELSWLQANAQLATARIPGHPVIAWVRDPWQDHAACELPPAGAAASRLTLVMGSDEYESTAVALTNAEPGQVRLTAAISELIGPGGRIPAADLTLRIGAFTDCRDGMQRPDALPLLDQEGAVLDPGCTRQLWLVARTSGQPAGTYAGELAIQHSAGRISLPVAIEVVAAALPRPLPLAAVDWGYLSFAPCKADPEAAIRDRAAHHINTAVLDAPELPRFAVDGSGALVSSDYTAFDATIALYRSAGIGRFLFFSFFGDMGGTKRPLGANVACPVGMIPGSRPWERALQAVITGWTHRCLDLGLGYDRFAFYPWDEPHDRQLPEAAVIWKAIRKADARALRFATTPGNSAEALLRIADDIDIWCPHLSRDKPLSDRSYAFYQARQAAGQQVWLYNCQGPDKSFPPLAHYRRLSWQAWVMGATGVGIWNYADTGHGRFTSAWTDLDGNREDFALVYDAATAPDGVSRREAQIPSRRWEAFRDGIEDHAYLWALRRAAAEARRLGNAADADEAETAIREAVTATETAPDAATIYAATHARILRCLAKLSSNR